MGADELKAVFDSLRRIYEQAAESHRNAAAVMAQTQAAIAALAPLVSDEPMRFEGTLADACRLALKSSTRPLAPTEVRDAIQARGYDLSQHNNPMASIHSVLKRLVESGDVRTYTIEVQTAGSDETKTTVEYLWSGKGEMKRAVAAFPPPTFQTYTDIMSTVDPAGILKMKEEIAAVTKLFNSDEVRRTMEQIGKDFQKIKLPDFKK